MTQKKFLERLLSTISNVELKQASRLCDKISGTYPNDTELILLALERVKNLEVLKHKIENFLNERDRTE